MFRLAEAAKDLADIPHTETVRKNLLRQALDFYEGLPGDEGGEPGRRKERRRRIRASGDLQSALENHRDAAGSYSRAAEIQERLSAKFPDDPAYRDDLAASYSYLARSCCAAEGPDAAAKPFRQALDLRTKLVEAFPDRPEYRDGLADAYNGRGAMLYYHGRYPEAMEDLGRACGAAKSAGR